MCEIIKIGDSTVIICGGHKKDHVCNEDATVYELRDGKRFTFTDKEQEVKWCDDNFKNIVMGSVACSICGRADIDDIRNFF